MAIELQDVRDLIREYRACQEERDWLNTLVGPLPAGPTKTALLAIVAAYDARLGAIRVRAVALGSA